MKYCQHCGKELTDDAVYCTECGGFNGAFGQQVNPNAQPTNNNSNTTTDGNNPSLNVLCFFFPLVGLILFLAWKKQYPIKAKNCGKWALISFIAAFILAVLQGF